MKFSELHEHIPLARYGKEKSLTMEPYKGIVLAMPGRHAEQTSPKGGDFVVMVTDDRVGWKQHQFKHDDIFNDVENRRKQVHLSDMHNFMEYYLQVVAAGIDPKYPPFTAVTGGITPEIFFHAIQCLAVAEHRRYHHHEEKFGGRFLPFRFAAGIAEGLWSPADAIKVQKYGRPAVERLEKNNGRPTLTESLMNT